MRWRVALQSVLPSIVIRIVLIWTLMVRCSIVSSPHSIPLLNEQPFRVVVIVFFSFKIEFSLSKNCGACSQCLSSTQATVKAIKILVTNFALCFICSIGFNRMSPFLVYLSLCLFCSYTHKHRRGRQVTGNLFLPTFKMNRIMYRGVGQFNIIDNTRG